MTRNKQYLNLPDRNRKRQRTTLRSGGKTEDGLTLLKRFTDMANNAVISLRTRLYVPVNVMGIRDRLISLGSPWQNGFVERLIGTLRRECLDQMLVFEPSSDLASLPASRSWPDYITDTSGYDFRKRQALLSMGAIATRSTDRATLSPSGSISLLQTRKPSRNRRWDPVGLKTVVAQYYLRRVVSRQASDVPTGMAA